MTPADTNESMRTGTAPSAEMDLNDDSMPVPDDAPVSRRTRLSLALASVLPAASGAVPDATDGAAAEAPSARRVRFSGVEESDDEIKEATDDEWDDSGYVFFAGGDDDEHANGDDNDDDSTAQRDGESSDEYEARLKSLVPPTQCFCCRPVFS